jgi:hypothetical protein
MVRPLIDDVLKQEFDLVNLDILGINCKRVSLDKFDNNYGNRLLVLCQHLNLLIANGRLGKDKKVGALTCKVSSLVDYCILTPKLFSYVVNFEILPFDPMLSDCYNALYLEFFSKYVTIRAEEIKSNNNPDTVVKPKWVNEKCELFKDCLCDDDIQTLYEKLDVLDVANVNKDVINNVIEECNDIIRIAAVNCELLSEVENRSNKRSVNRNGKLRKPWFNKDCSIKRKLYHKAKNYNWRVRPVESKANLIRCSKEYKKVLNTQFHLYNKTFINKVGGLKQTDSTSYWSLLNRTCSNENKQKIVKNMSMNCFLEHFRKLNTVQDVNEQEDDTFEHVDVNNVSNLNIELNS